MPQLLQTTGAGPPGDCGRAHGDGYSSNVEAIDVVVDVDIIFKSSKVEVELRSEVLWRLRVLVEQWGRSIGHHVFMGDVSTVASNAFVQERSVGTRTVYSRIKSLALPRFLALSQVFSSGPYPFHCIRYLSDCPSPRRRTLLLRIFSIL